MAIHFSLQGFMWGPFSESGSSNLTLGQGLAIPSLCYFYAHKGI